MAPCESSRSPRCTKESKLMLVCDILVSDLTFIPAKTVWEVSMITGIQYSLQNDCCLLAMPQFMPMLYRMSTHLDICKDKLLAAQFQELVFEDALGVVQSRVNQVGHPANGLTLPEWEIVMRDEHMSNYIVMFLRLLTSAEIQLNRDSFAPFILVR